MPFGVRGESRVSAIQQSSDLFHHTFFQTGVEPAVYLCIALLARYQCTYIICVLGKEACAVDRVLSLINRYFQGADKALACVVVGGVVKRLERGQLRDKLFV